MIYLTKFKSDGRRVTSYPVDNDMTKDKYNELVNEGYIEIDEEDFNYYIGNRGAGANGTGYIRGEDGKPTDAPAYVPSVEEQLAQLDAQFRLDQATIMEYFTQAVFDGDTEAQADLKEEMEEIKTTYAEERKALEEE